MLHFFSLNPDTRKFEDTPGRENGFFIGDTPISIFWEDKYIYMLHKKAYLIMDMNGNNVQQLSHDKVQRPLMVLSKTDCIILGPGNEGLVFTEKGALKTKYRFDPSKEIVSIVQHEIYIIVVYEHSVAIYNNEGAFLDEKGRLEKTAKSDHFRYTSVSLNFMTGGVVLGANNKSSGKNSTTAEIYTMNEIPHEHQIDSLLF